MSQKLISNVFLQAFTRADDFCHVRGRFLAMEDFDHEFHFQDYIIPGFSEDNLSAPYLLLVTFWE